MDYAIIGSIIGLVMGLTGSGGALVAIPLFMLFLDMGLKQASVLSLAAVIFASGLNFIPLFRSARVRMALTMFATSLVGSFVSIPLKQQIPELGIALLLGGISVFSVVMIWRPVKPAKEKQDSKSPRMLVAEIAAGGVLGVLTTLTGLGGGVLLMPILIGPFRLRKDSAMATSLLTILLSSLSSLSMQIWAGQELPPVASLFWLGAGTSITALLLSVIVKRANKDHMELLRKIVFSMVVALALAKIF